MQGIAGHGYYGNCIVPIIENTARECELTGELVMFTIAWFLKFAPYPFGHSDLCLRLTAQRKHEQRAPIILVHTAMGGFLREWHGAAGRLREAIQQYPESNAVLVRRHGVYVWGKDWIQAKTQAEVL